MHSRTDSEDTDGYQEADCDDEVQKELPKRMVALSLPVSWPASIKIREGLGITPGSLLGQEDIVEITQSFQLGVSYIRPSFKIQNLASWHPLPLDPNSMGHMLFELCTIVFLTIDLTLIPLVLAWDLPLTDVWMSFNIFSVLFWTADIGISFTTSFTIDGEVGQCVLRPFLAKLLPRALCFHVTLFSVGPCPSPLSGPSGSRETPVRISTR